MNAVVGDSHIRAELGPYSGRPAVLDRQIFNGQILNGIKADRPYRISTAAAVGLIAVDVHVPDYNIFITCWMTLGKYIVAVIGYHGLITHRCVKCKPCGGAFACKRDIRWYFDGICERVTAGRQEDLPSASGLDLR